MEATLKKFKQFIKSQFFIPWFYTKSQIEILEEDISDFIDEDTLYFRIKDSQIKVFKANYSKIQEIYLTHD